MTSDQYGNRFLKLINGLIRTTPPDPNGRGGRKWEKVAEYTYDLNLTRSTLRIASRDNDGNYPYVFSILDQDGQPTDIVEDDGRDEFGEPGWRLGELYSLASRSHSGAEKKLIEVLQELGFEESDPWDVPAADPSDSDDEPLL